MKHKLFSVKSFELKFQYFFIVSCTARNHEEYTEAAKWRIMKFTFFFGLRTEFGEMEEEKLSYLNNSFDVKFKSLHILFCSFFIFTFFFFFHLMSSSSYRRCEQEFILCLCVYVILAHLKISLKAFPHYNEQPFIQVDKI